MQSKHTYKIGLVWQGGVAIEKRYRYHKTYELSFDNKPSLVGSADATFHGDANLYNPEEMLLAALSSCHMMSFFYLCSKEQIILKSYEDNPVGQLQVNANGSGQFSEVLLQPTIIIGAVDQKEMIKDLFSKAHDYCFIARSCNFSIKHQPKIVVR